eukprot:18522-Pelagococcus_subviridis.AAC.14
MMFNGSLGSRSRVESSRAAGPNAAAITMIAAERLYTSCGSTWERRGREGFREEETPRLSTKAQIDL